MEIGKKIIVMGGSCAGKSTMSQNLSEKFNLPVFYLDLYDPYAVPDGPEREERKQKINQVIQDAIDGDSWVIDGTYSWYSFKERFDKADTLILLVSPVYRRLWCYVKTCALKIKRHGRQGFSAKNFRWDHVWYMLRKHDAPYKEIDEAIQKHPDLQVVKLKSYKEATEFLKSVRLKTKQKKDSIMSRICQSCSMPMEDESLFGTNKDGSVNSDYCIYCYKNGEFIDKVSMQEYIEMMVPFSGQAHMTPDEMRLHCEKVFPTLKRWKKQGCTNEIKKS